MVGSGHRVHHTALASLRNSASTIDLPASLRKARRVHLRAAMSPLLMYRSLRRTPALSAAAIACAAIGVAATTSVATLISATLMRPVPFPHADRLVRVWLAEAGGDPRVMLSIPDLRDIESSIRSFDAFLGTARSRLIAMLPTGAARMRGEGVTRDYFPALGVRPQLGRFLVPDDFEPDAPHVMVLSAATWVRHYGADPSAIGRTLRAGDIAYTIVGVAPSTFHGTVEQDIVEFWVPLPQYLPARLLTDRSGRSAWAIGRLRDATTPAAADAEVQALFAALREQHPGVYERLSVRLEPIGENWRVDFRTSGALLFGAAALLLLIAALNVAGLLVARTLDRRRELAIRASLGASRRRAIIELTAEGVVLVGLGGLVGAFYAPELLALCLAASPVPLPRYVSLVPDRLTTVISFATVLSAGLLAGGVPAVLSSRVDPADALKQSGRGAIGGAGERAWGSWVVAAEVALTLALLVAGGLLLRSYQALSTLDVGYRVDGIARLAMTVSAEDVRDQQSLDAFYVRLRNELLAHPGVEHVGLASPTLPPWDPQRARISFAELPPQLLENGLAAGIHFSDPGLLPMLGVTVVAGRNFDTSDASAEAPVAIVSRTLAGRLGGLHAALGREIRIVTDPMLPSSPLRIVGVAEDVTYDGLGEQGTGRLIRYGDTGDARAARDDVYLPLAGSSQRTVSIGAFTRGDAASMIEPLRQQIGRIAPASAVYWTGTMGDELAIEYAAPRFYALLINVFSLGALTLTGVGLFAVLSHLVARRTGEIGLRAALGATRGHLVSYVARLSLPPLVCGLGLGALGAVVAARATAGVLYGVSPFDLAAFAGGAAALIVVAAIAAALPARRAARIDPMIALRQE
jgi:putative ABC transport system permease protein